MDISCSGRGGFIKKLFQASAGKPLLVAIRLTRRKPFSLAGYTGDESKQQGPSYCHLSKARMNEERFLKTRCITSPILPRRVYPSEEVSDRRYGRLPIALQIVGSLKVPISKKKDPMEWTEIHALVVEIREELG